MTRPPSDNGVRIWDLPTRLFHWALVVLIALQYASGEFGLFPMKWHYLLGYTTLALILFRVLWGFAGSETSQFGGFLRGPRAVFHYLVDTLRGGKTRIHGHNPLGGWSIVSMLACVAAQALSGLFASDDISEEGPLTDRVSDAVVDLMTRIHQLNRYVLLALIVLHIGAVLAHWLIRDDNLVAPMLHGRARFESQSAPRLVSPWRALGLLAISATLVWAIVAWGGTA